MPKSFSDINYETLFCLFKGEAGTRKSTAALSFPKPIYFFDFDNKMEALGLPIKQWGIKHSDIKYDTYTDWNSCLTQLERFQTNCPYKTLVMDSVTSIADAINRQTLKIKGVSKEGGGKSVAGIPVNSIEDFNAEDSALKEMVARLKDIKDYAKVNIILIAHVIQKEVKSSDGKTHMARTLLTAGKGIAQKIPAYCSETYHFNIKTGFDADKGGEYGLFTVHTGDDMARSSLPLPAHILFNNEPLYDKWIRPAIDIMQATVVKQPTTATPTPFTK